MNPMIYKWFVMFKGGISMLRLEEYMDSVFAVSGFTAVLGIYLNRGWKENGKISDC